MVSALSPVHETFLANEEKARPLACDMQGGQPLIQRG